MSFVVAADAYDRFMGRYSTLLAPVFADFAGVEDGQRVLDVGCGPGALTNELVRRLHAENVAAADPSGPFVEAARERHPGVTVELAAAEDLPFADGNFDQSLAQLVVQFMTDPAGGLHEMKRVTRRGGTVAACVWDHGGERGPLSPLWAAARELRSDVVGESMLVGTHGGDLTRLLDEAGLVEVVEQPIEVSLEHATFDEWWEPYTLGVGPAGAYVAGLEPADRDALEERCRTSFGDEPFTVTARAWACRGTV